MKSVFIHHTGSKTYIALTGTFSMNVGEPIAPLNPVGWLMQYFKDTITTHVVKM